MEESIRPRRRVKESQLRKMRMCKTCKTTIYGTAAKLREHQEYHNMATKYSHVLIPKTTIEVIGNGPKTSA